MKSDTPREDRTATVQKMSLKRPAAGGESCNTGFFLIDNYVKKLTKLKEEKRCTQMRAYWR